MLPCEARGGEELTDLRGVLNVHERKGELHVDRLLPVAGPRWYDKWSASCSTGSTWRRCPWYPRHAGPAWWRRYASHTWESGWATRCWPPQRLADLRRERGAVR